MSQLGGGTRSFGGSTWGDPFQDVSSLMMPENINLALRWCFHPNTRIEMGDLTLKTIQDVAPGDTVLTKGGTIEAVDKVSKREVDEELIHICVHGFGKNRPLRVTSNHKLFGYSVASRGKEKRKANRVKLNLNKLSEIPARELKAGDYVVCPLPKREPSKVQRFFGWMVGMYIAEGCLVRDAERIMSARFTLGKDDEANGILQRLLETTSESVGKPQCVYTPLTRPEIRLITVSDVELPDFLGMLCPGLAHEKQISGGLWQTWSDSYILDVLGGWLDGDGCIARDHDRFIGAIGVTSSPVLANQIARLANIVGLTPAIYSRNNYDFRDRTRLVHPSHVLTFNKTDCQVLVDHSIKLTKAKTEFGISFIPQTKGQKSVVIKDGLIWRRIKHVDHVKYKGPVYNLEICNDHNYIADNILALNCEFVMSKLGTYRQAVSRVLAYFITDIEISDAGDEEKEKYEDFLRETLGIYKTLYTIGSDYMCYGNAFVSVMMPFKRYLYCPKCFYEAPLRKIALTPQYDFKWSNWEFNAKCPACSYKGKWGRQDRRETQESELVVKRWNPHEIEIEWDPITEQSRYIWKIPDDYRTAIRQGKSLHMLERVPWHVVETIKNNNNMRFDKDVIYHMKEEHYSGVRSRGWGVSRVLTNFSQAYYVQVLRRFNEAIALDYVIPFRVVTPEPAPGSDGLGAKDPLSNMNMGGFVNKFNSLIRQHRRDPATWHVFPIPVQYQTLGGDASKLAPRELLDQGLEVLLNDIGVPAEMYKGSLQMQTAPAALRLFESSWTPLIFAFNALLRFIVGRVSHLLSWKPVKVKLMRVTHADDLNRQMAKLQLMMGKQISKSTGLKSIGLDNKEEIQKIMADEKMEAEEQMEMQEDMDQLSTMKQMNQPQQQGQQGQPGQQGDPNQQGGQPQQGQQGQPQQGSITANLPMGDNTPITPQELLSRAQSIAQQIMGLPETQKDSELINLKKTNPVLHDLVKSNMEQLRNQAKNVGGAQVLQQQFGKQGSAQEIHRLHQYVQETSNKLRYYVKYGSVLGPTL